jgi:hypothetical protein
LSAADGGARDLGECITFPSTDRQTLVLAVLYTGFALVSHSPDITSKNRFSRKYSRVYVVIFTVPALVFAAYQLLRHPSTPFHIPDGNGGTSTVLLSQKGVSGRIVVSEVAHESGWQYRFLRADHSILGGQWLTKVTDDKGVNRMEFSDSIFAAFPLQEVLLLAERGDLSAPPRPAPGESALVM